MGPFGCREIGGGVGERDHVVGSFLVTFVMSGGRAGGVVRGGRDAADDCSNPDLWGFCAMFGPTGIGSLGMVWAGQIGDAGVGMMVGRTPRVPERVPTSGPLSVVALSALLTVTVGECVDDIGSPDDFHSAGFGRLDAVFGERGGEVGKRPAFIDGRLEFG